MSAVKWDFKVHKSEIRKFGYALDMLESDKPGSAKEQFVSYFGGKWNPREFGFRLLPNGSLQTPFGSQLKLLAEGNLRDETVRLYDGEYILIIQANGDYEVTSATGAIYNTFNDRWLKEEGGTATLESLED